MNIFPVVSHSRISKAVMWLLPLLLFFAALQANAQPKCQVKLGFVPPTPNTPGSPGTDLTPTPTTFTITEVPTPTGRPTSTSLARGCRSPNAILNRGDGDLECANSRIHMLRLPKVEVSLIPKYMPVATWIC
jgi:hypothetical protein